MSEIKRAAAPQGKREIENPGFKDQRDKGLIFNHSIITLALMCIFSFSGAGVFASSSLLSSATPISVLDFYYNKLMGNKNAELRFRSVNETLSGLSSQAVSLATPFAMPYIEGVFKGSTYNFIAAKVKSVWHKIF